MSIHKPNVIAVTKVENNTQQTGQLNLVCLSHVDVKDYNLHCAGIATILGPTGHIRTPPTA